EAVWERHTTEDQTPRNREREARQRECRETSWVDCARYVRRQRLRRLREVREVVARVQDGAECAGEREHEAPQGERLVDPPQPLVQPGEDDRRQQAADQQEQVVGVRGSA